MNYGRLEAKSQSEPEPELPQDPDAIGSSKSATKSKSKLKLLLLVIGIGLIIAAAVSVTVALSLRSNSSRGGSGSMIHPQPTKAISRVCSRTLYQNLCVNSFVDFPGALTASDKDLVHISVNMTLRRVGKALYASTDFNNMEMSARVRSAYSDCLELLEESMEQLEQSLTTVAPSSSSPSTYSFDDVMTWLSASLTNQETCTDGLSDAEEGEVKDLMKDKVKDLAEMVSNSLAIYSSSKSDTSEGDDIGVQDPRRRLMSSPEMFPEWVSKKERNLMEMPAAAIQADVVVSKDGNGTCKTIKEAIKMAPEKSSRRFIIYVKAGR